MNPLCVQDIHPVLCLGMLNGCLACPCKMPGRGYDDYLQVRVPLQMYEQVIISLSLSASL